MSSQGYCDRKRDSRRSSVVPRGATSTTVDSTHDIEPRAALKIFRALWVLLFLRSIAMRERVLEPLLFQVSQRPPPCLLPICSHNVEQRLEPLSFHPPLPLEGLAVGVRFGLFRLWASFVRLCLFTLGHVVLPP